MVSPASGPGRFSTNVGEGIMPGFLLSWQPRVLPGRDLKGRLCLQGVGCLPPLGASPTAKKNKGTFPIHFIYLKGKTGSASGKPLIAAL